MTFRILAGLALAGCVTGGPRIATTVPPILVPGHVHVHIAADDGSVRVSTADISQVELRVESSGYDVPRDLDLSMTPHGDQVDIVARTRDHWRILDFTRRSLHIDVIIPRDADVEVEGDINGGGPPIVVRTGDGSIRLTQI
jgi:hypothetical protein